MKRAAFALFISGCTTLGPMPATTGISATPIARPGAQATLGAVPGFYASQSAQNEAKGAPIKQLSLLLDPNHWLPVKGLIFGGRIFGESGDTPGEPYLGYRRHIVKRVSFGAIVFGSTKRSESKLATYHGFRLGGEAMVEADVWEPKSWLRVRLQGAASITRILASGAYCVDDAGVARDCNEDDPSMNQMIAGKTVGAYPAGTATLSLDVGKHDGFLDGAQLAVMSSVGRMPLVLAGQESGTGTYFTLGLSLTVAVGFGRAATAE